MFNSKPDYNEIFNSKLDKIETNLKNEAEELFKVLMEEMNEYIDLSESDDVKFDKKINDLKDDFFLSY